MAAFFLDRLGGDLFPIRPGQKKRPQRGGELRPSCGSVMGADTIPERARAKTVPPPTALCRPRSSRTADYLSASRINPSPVTTGPFSVIATQRSATNLANMIAGIFQEDAPRATERSAASSSGVRSAGPSL
jgi:hypothetical protein